MFFVKTKKRELKVSFYYGAAILRDYSRTVGCRIKHEEDLISEGIAYCHPKDNFCKNTGRKVAMARALKSFTSSPTLRKLFWEAYAEKRGGFD